tara:strand:+ start:2018 stop:2401 length:384 start_codon:yes stop_codon:yes gene_type:complete
MKEISKPNKTINYCSLKRAQFAENYALTLQELYSDIASIPHFNDEEVMLEDWGIDFFYIDTKEELEWMVIIALQIFINQTGYEVSHVLTNQKFKELAVIQEYSCLGKNFIMFNNGIEINAVEVEDEF